MSGKPDPVAAVGSLAPAVVPAARFRTTMSLKPIAESLGRRLNVPVGASKATTWPSALIADRSVVPLAWTPAALWAARTVVPAAMSRTTMSEASLPSPGNRLVASPLPNETARPS